MNAEAALFAAVDRADAALESIHSALPAAISELDALRATVARVRALCDDPDLGWLIHRDRIAAALDPPTEGQP